MVIVAKVLGKAELFHITIVYLLGKLPLFSLTLHVIILFIRRVVPCMKVSYGAIFQVVREIILALV